MGRQKGGIRMLVALLRRWRGGAVVCMLMHLLADMLVRMAVEEGRGRRRRRRRAPYGSPWCNLEERNGTGNHGSRECDG